MYINTFRKEMVSYIEDVFQWQCSRCRTNYHEEHWATVAPDTPSDTYTTDNTALGHVKKNACIL